MKARSVSFRVIVRVGGQADADALIDKLSNLVKDAGETKEVLIKESRSWVVPDKKVEED